jgi:hypothetical protein
MQGLFFKDVASYQLCVHFRLLSNSGVPKSLSRDRFVWSCQLGIIFAGSWMAGYLKSE